MKIEEYDNFDIAPLDIDILKVVDRIETNMEMHDKIIAATALFHNATLITKDEIVKNAQIISTVW